MKYAVIDLGTNTFHLLIAQCGNHTGWEPLVRERIFVKLAEEGIEQIGPAAFERGLEAMISFRRHLDAAGIPPERVLAYGTAALRTARNAPDFLQEVKSRTGIRAEPISGKREALLICKGVQQAVPLPENRALVMDIGGGSVEMTLVDRERVYWYHSFPVGVAVLFRRFHKNDPIDPAEIAAVDAFLEEQLADLWKILQLMPAPTLIGAAGAFDIIDNLLLDPATKPPLYGWIPAADFAPLYDRITRSTRAEREHIPHLVPERREMIVVGMILIHKILQKAGIREIYTSVYSMKEGMLAEMLEEDRELPKPR